MPSAPGYSYWIPIPRGALREAIREPLEFQIQARERFGDIVRFRLAGFVTHFLYHPAQVSRVLRDQQKIYQRGWQYNLLRNLFGDNLVVSEGEYWRRQRRLAQPAFHQRRLATYAETMTDAILELICRWREDANRGETVEVETAMSKLALKIAGRTLFGLDVSSEADAIGTSFHIVSQYLDYRFKNPLTSPPISWPTSRNRQFRRAKKTLLEIVLSLIQERRREGIERNDLLSTLIQARDEETGEQMSDEQICVEALTFLIAGHETTAKGLTWTLFLLATHTPVRERLRNEARSMLAEERPTAENAVDLKATRMAIEESMRLFPPVWVLARQAIMDDEIDGFHIPAKSSVVLCPFVTHRHPEFWPHPNDFDPNRFSSEQAASRPAGAYFPFILGPHQCIGKDFAMLEMCLVISMILREFDFDLAPNQVIRPVAALTLNPSSPILIRHRLVR